MPRQSNETRDRRHCHNLILPQGSQGQRTDTDQLPVYQSKKQDLDFLWVEQVLSLEPSTGSGPNPQKTQHKEGTHKQ